MKSWLCFLGVSLLWWQLVGLSLASHPARPAFSKEGLVEAFARSGEQPLNCTTCVDKSQCCGGEQCCQLGDFCCPSNATCCSETCCDAAQETCCGPQYGESGVCCISQTSFCCAPSGGYKSRCCPRWTVCCEFESDGCCDPATLDLYLSDAATATATATATAVASVTAMFTRGTDGMLEATVINASSGEQGAFVKAPEFDTYGEATQIFLYSPKNGLFYLLRANYSAPQPYPITFYSVDPSSGEVQSTAVSNAAGQVTGQAFAASLGAIVFATATDSGYDFYRITPGSSTAQRLSSFDNSASGVVDLWTGYFSAVSADGTLLYRVGYQNAVTGANPGLGTTSIASSVATTSWKSPVAVPPKYGFYQTATLLNATAFLSLATHEASGDLGLFAWDISGASAQLVAQFSNAHTIPLFGSIAQYSSGTQYAAFVAYGKRDPLHDLWELLTVDLASGATTAVTLSPKLYAGATPLSGIGF